MPFGLMALVPPAGLAPGGVGAGTHPIKLRGFQARWRRRLGEVACVLISRAMAASAAGRRRSLLDNPPAFRAVHSLRHPPLSPVQLTTHRRSAQDFGAKPSMAGELAAALACDLWNLPTDTWRP